MSKAYFIDTVRSVKLTISRFISIVAIVALGSSVFVGFNGIYPDMTDTANEYYEKYNLLDIRLQSYIGIYDGDLEKIRAMDEVKAVQGAKFVDGYVQTPTKDGTDYSGIVDIDGSPLTLKVLGFDVNQATAFDNGAEDINYINRLKLTEGRYPENTHECVVTCSSLTTPDEFQIGNKIRVVGDGEEISYYIKENEFEIVGIVLSPYWVSYERGVTTAGSGKLGDFIYVSNDCFTDKISYYSEVYVTLKNPGNFEAYTPEYEAYVDGVQEKILDASADIVKIRSSLLIAGLPEKLLDAGLQISKAEAEINQKLEDGRKKLAELYELEKTGEQQLKDAQAEMDQKFAEANEQLQNGSQQYIDAVNEYNAKATYVANSKVTLEQKKAEYNANKVTADEAKNLLDDANVKLTLSKAEINAAQVLVDSTRNTLATLQSSQAVSQSDLDLEAMAARLEQTNPDLAKTLRAASNLTAQGMAADAIVEVEALLSQYEAELKTATEQYDAGKAEYDSKYAQWESADAQLKAAKEQLDASQRMLDDAEAQLAAYEKKITESGLTLKLGSLEAQTKYTNAQVELATKTSQFQNIKSIIASAEKQLADGEKEADEKLGAVKTEYNKGKNLYENIMNGAYWSVYDRNDSPGYTGYGQVADNMRKLSYVFPTFFFIVSTLICLTTMTRMVEEERTQLGTLKALGYSNSMIIGKYLIYSILASSIGCIIGISIGFYAFPIGIFAAWQIMYEMPSLIVHYLPLYIFLGILFSVGTTALAAFLACRKELASVPAVLMRPKPPKDGKRVFLENIKFIWKRLNFTSKVTVRNLFRNKKRFFVTVFGIAGCTALLLAAFGLQTSIGSVIDMQYGPDGVAQYDLQVVLKNGQADYEHSEKVAEINALDGIEDSMLGFLKVCTGYSDRSDKEVEVDVLVTQSPDRIADFINITDGKTKLSVSDEGAIITSKLAKKTNTKVGDMISMTWLEGATTVNYSVKVLGIADNYTFHYIYLTPACYYNITGGVTPTYNYLFCKLADGFGDDSRAELETQINNLDDINGTVYTTVVIDSFNNIVNALNIITIILIVAAMALAIIVLYNLNNINVNERIRELATLKVLGFYDGEVSAYIYRENIFLTLIGIAVGLFIGIFLHILIIGAIDIDTVTFATDLQALSFVYAGVLTVIFSALVNIAMHFKLKKISMVESLKSVE